jgi:hypothetical protein
LREMLVVEMRNLDKAEAPEAGLTKPRWSFRRVQCRRNKKSLKKGRDVFARWYERFSMKYFNIALSGLKVSVC